VILIGFKQMMYFITQGKMDIINLCHKLFGFNNFQLEHNPVQCSIRIHSKMTGGQYIDMTSSFVDFPRDPEFDQEETMKFTFYLTNEPIFIITINEEDNNEEDRFMWFELEHLSKQHKNRNTWKMLYIALAQRYTPIIYGDDLLEEEYDEDED
jgi:hypothetical protein